MHDSATLNALRLDTCRKALVDDSFLEAARLVIAEMAIERGFGFDDNLDYTVTPEDLAEVEALAHASQLERAFVGGRVVWSGDVPIMAPELVPGMRVIGEVNLSDGSYSITGTIVGQSPLGVVVKCESTGARFHLDANDLMAI
jgi:hypothetical protein